MRFRFCITLTSTCVLAGARREAAALADACERYAAEARRLAPAAEADAVAGEFAALQRSLEQPPAWRA